uniref:Uncharacterized protein n=1 Tax=Oryza meridionalis TaxID=40149 RepID=A0A0E0CWZ5_9ORYZ
MAFRGWPRARLCRWLRSRYNCLWDVLDYSVAIDVGVLVWMLAKAFSCLEPVRRRRRPRAPFPFLEALSWRSFISPTNLQPCSDFRTSGGGVTRRVLLGGVTLEKFQRIDDCRWSFSFQKLLYLVFGEAFAFLGPLPSCGGRRALRLFLLIKSKLLADGVRRCSATMTCCSLFQGVSGAGRVKEVAPR